jgi:hypothetical protein
MPCKESSFWAGDGWQGPVFLSNEIRHPYSGEGPDDVVLSSAENRVG